MFKHVYARMKDRGEKALDNLALTLTWSSSSGTFDEPSQVKSPSTTPKIGTVTTVGNFFDINESLPSPPKGKDGMLMKEIHETLEIVCPDYEVLAQSGTPNDNEKYSKLVYAVGAGFFDQSLENILTNTSPILNGVELFHLRLIAEQISDKESPHGHRFHVMYSEFDANERKWTIEENKTSEKPINTYEQYVEKRRLPSISDFRESDRDATSCLYECFNDKENHPNLEPFYREQNQGTCFAQASILIHYYLQLVHDKELTADMAQQVELPRFLRNFFSGEALYDYIKNYRGERFQTVLEKLIEKPELADDYGSMSFASYVDKLKAHGPAIVKMFVGNDFHKRNTYAYKGNPDPVNKNNQREGHAMVLVGVIKIGEDKDIAKGMDVCFILQNFWQRKQFVSVRRDYFRSSVFVNRRYNDIVDPEGPERPSIHWITSYSPKFADPETIYASPVLSTRVTYSSHHLERPVAIHARRLKIKWAPAPVY
eukprot:scaffold72431_cov44-Attheya_sp.AAC.2